MNEFKEYWIDDILNVNRPYQRTAYQHYDDTEGFHGKTVHVIEYAAFETAENENEQLKKENTNLKHTCERRYEVLMAENQAGQLIETKLKTQAEIIEKLEKLIKDDTCNSVREALALISEGEGNNIEVYRQMSKSALNKIDETLVEIAELKKVL